MPHYKILVVDDDPDDREFMNEAFQVNSFNQHLILSSGEEVFHYLDSVEMDEDLPHLIISDLNMPGLSGFQLLRALKTHNRYKNIDVFVYSTSSMGSHIDLCLALGAKEFIPKPYATEGFHMLVKHITHSVIS